MQNSQTNFGTLWNGSPQFATKNSLLSTSAGLYTYTTATSNYATGASNVLQGEIDAIVAGGTTSLWANYPAIHAVEMGGYDVLHARYVSTMDMQCSSINGADVKFTGDTITIGGITIVNNTLKAAQVEKTTDVWDTVNSAIGAAGNAVSVVHQAASGFLADSGSALQQVLWTTYAVDKVVNLATDVVSLTTGIQGLINSRSDNNISGGGVPGQTTNVYETFNGTTQFQFSTLGADTTTVFRTTDQTNPNITLGREIFISTIIPAGSKVVRAVGDPMALPILSTQLLSTTNYAQSFGQWTAILGTDYNLTASTLKADRIYGFASLSTGKISTTQLEVRDVNVYNLLNASNLYVAQNATVVGGLTAGSFATGAFSAVGATVGSLSTNQISTGAALISSINGQPIAAFINEGNVSFNSVSTNQISTAKALISSINGININTIINPPPTPAVDIPYLSSFSLSTGTLKSGSISSLLLSTGTATVGSLAAFGNITTTGSVGAASVAASGALTGNSVAVSGNLTGGNVIVSGTLQGATANIAGTTTSGNLTATGTIAGVSLNVSGTATAGNITTGGVMQTAGFYATGNGLMLGKLTVNGSIEAFGTYTPNILAGTTNIANANITTTNTTVVNAGAANLALTYGSITFNGSPYAPTSPGGSDISVNSISTNQISTATSYISSINGVNINTILNPQTTNIPYLSSLTVSTGTLWAGGVSSLSLSTGSALMSSINGVNITTILNPVIPTTNIPYLSSLTVSTGTLWAGGVSSLSLSTGSAYISSINGQPIAAFINSGDVSFTSISTNSISTGSISTGYIYGSNAFFKQAAISSIIASSIRGIYGEYSTFMTSSIQATGGLTFSTPIQYQEQNKPYDITKSYYLYSTTYDAVSSLQHNILNYTYSLGLPGQATVIYPFPADQTFTLEWSDIGTYGGNLLTFAQAEPGVNQKSVTVIMPNSTTAGTPVPGTFCDWKNTYQLTSMVIYSANLGIICSIPWGDTYRINYVSGTSYTFTTGHPQVPTVNTTSFNITQTINGAAISTSDMLTLTGTDIILNSAAVYARDVEAANLNVLSISSFIGSVSSFTSEDITAKNTTTTYSTITNTLKSQSITNAAGISTLTLGANTVSAVNLNANSIVGGSVSLTSLTTPNINTSHLTASDITATIVSTNRLYAQEAGGNGFLVADTAYASSIVVQSGLAYPYPMYHGTYSNVVAIPNAIVPPTTEALTSYNQMLITSPNPTITYSGHGGDIITFRKDGSVYYNGTLQTSIGWEYATFTTNNSITLNFSTPTVSYAFSPGIVVANLTTGASGYITVNTSYSGNIATISGNSQSSILWSAIYADYRPTTFTPLTPILNQSYSQTKQTVQSITTISDVSTITKAPYIGFGEQGYQIDTFQITLDAQFVNKTAPGGAAYGFADNGSRITNPLTGRTYLMSEWTCICSIAGHNAYQQVTLATNEVVVITENDGGYWKAHAYMTTATVVNIAAPSNRCFWKIAVVMIPIAMGTNAGLQTATNLGDIVPSTIAAFSPWAIDTPLANFSTITGSTFQVRAETNLSLNSGLNFPTFLGTGNVSINASTNVDVMAGYATTITAPNIILTGNVNLSSINNAAYPPAAIIPSALTVSSISAKAITNLSSINGVAYTNGTITSSFTNLYTSSIGGNPLNYLSLVANRNITKTALSSITLCPASYFSGDVRVSSLNGAAVGGGGGGSWVGTATSALNMGTYAINGSALTINSSNSGDFTIKNQAGSGGSLNLIGDTYVFFQSRQYDMYFDPHTDIGGNAPGNFNFGGNNFYANSYQAMYFTNYGTSGYGMNFQSGDRIFMNSATQFTAKCTGLYVELNGYGGVQIVDSSTGGSGYLTVDSGNHLYWNGVFIA